MYDITAFQKGLSELNIELTENQVNQFLEYYELLIEKNKVMNLTAITEFEDVVQKHFLDSLSIIKEIDLRNKLSMIDVGTGAGFPGIPIKIVYPEIDVILMDSLNKRINFLNEVIEKLGLKNIQAVHARAEDLGKNKVYREKFDLCVSRAVSNLASLSEYCLPFVKKDGIFISYKAGNIGDELKQAQLAIKTLGGEVRNKEEFLLPESDISRVLVVIHKVKNTPQKYPRKAGLPAKEPIL